MVIVAMNTLMAVALGFGALQELYVVGIRGGQMQPFWTGTIGALVCLLLIVSGVAFLRRWNGAREFAILVALVFVAFHAYASLPPHRNVGVGAALAACVYGIGFLVFAQRHDRATQTDVRRV